MNYKDKTNKKKENKVLKAIKILALCYIALLIIISIGSNSTVNNTTTNQKTVNNLLGQTMNLTQDQNQKMSEILESCGMGEITYCNEEKKK